MNYRRFLATAAGAAALVAIAFSGVIKAATDAAIMTFSKITYTSDSTGSAIFDSVEIYSINSSGIVLSAAGQFVNTASNPGKDVSAFTDRFVKCFAGGNVGAQPIRINDAGDIAGVRGGSIAGAVASGFVCKASGELININVPGALSTVVRGFNNNGDVTGYYQDQFGAKHGYIFKNGAYTKIDHVGTPANPFSGTVIFAINDKGDAVGSAEDSKHDTQAFVYSNGLIKPLPPLPIAPSRPTSFPAQYVGIMEPRGINNSGQIVGTYTYFDSSMTGRSKGIILNSASWQLVDYPNAANTSFWAINDRGQIAGGFGNNYLSPESGFIANPVLLEVDIFDATGIAVSANENDGILYDKSKSPLNEAALGAFNPPAQAKGLVADGNARLIVRTKSNVSGTITVTVNRKPTSAEPNNTGTSANIYPVIASGIVNADGSTSLANQEVSPGTQLPHQASFTLKAGYDYSGTADSKESPFSIDVCLKKFTDSTTCDAKRHIGIVEKRAPVLLIHGLWANASSFKTSTGFTSSSASIGKEGLANALARANYSVQPFEYDGNSGPTISITNNLASKIDAICSSQKRQGYACTRSDIVAHSLGGIVARYFISANPNYKNSTNFQNGAISKLIMIGTPNLGSPFAALLRPLSYPNDPSTTNLSRCVQVDKILNRLVPLVQASGHEIQSAIDDLAPGSNLLKYLNSRSQNVYASGIIGNIGSDIVFTPTWFGITNAVSEVFTGCTGQQIFQGSSTDGIVTAQSATGSLSKNFTAFGANHVGMGTNPAVNAFVITRLAMPVNIGYNEKIAPIN